jgi:hypothetical protein
MGQPAGASAGTVDRSLRIALALTLAFAAFVFATQSARSEDPDHGDYWSDTMILLAARNLDVYGFAAQRFGVTMDDGPALGLEPYYYVHWPSFPTVALAVLRKLGCSVRAARIFPLLVSSSALVAVFLLVRRAIRSEPAAFAAMAALAAQAPYRLLSDSFCYQSYDFAAKTWTLLFVVLACTSDGRARRRAIAAAAAGAFATMFLCGFEMVPAIAIGAAAFPLALGDGDARRRVRLGATLAGAVSLGFVLAFAARLVHNATMLGGLRAAVDDMRTAAGVRLSTDFPRLLGWGFRAELWYRMRDYHWPSLAALIASGCAAGALALRSREWRRRLEWLALIAAGECAWLLAFRHHTYFHPHTAYHVALTLAVGVGLGFDAIREATRGRRVGRAALAAGSVAWLAVALSNVGIRGRGNLQVRTDLAEFEHQVRDAAAHVPEDAVVACFIDGREPCLDYWLRRTMLLWRGVDGEIDLAGRPLFVIALPGHREPRWKEFARKYRLVHRMPLGWDVFDTRLPPGPLNEAALSSS